MTLGLEPPGWCQPPAEARCPGRCRECRLDCWSRGSECGDDPDCSECHARSWCPEANPPTEGDEE